MRKITIIEHISLDGIIQAPGGPDEDGDYKHGGWVVPFSDTVVGQAIVAAHGSRLDLILGRRTYDIWAAYWPTIRGSSMADIFNAATKYVATHRSESLDWGPSRALSGDFVEQLRSIKSSDGPNLIVWGSSTLMPVLLGNSLADEVILLTYPVLLGSGKRFFSHPTDAREMGLVSSQVGTTGVLINTYRPVCPLRTGSFLEPPH